jgi:hypothetical protein
MSDPIREYYFIVPDADDAHVLLVPAGKAWTLPHTTLTGAYKWQSTAHVNKAANETFGFRATTRRCASPDMDPGSLVQEVVYVIENHSATWTLLSTARWVDAARRLSIAGCPNRGLVQLVESVDHQLVDTVVMKPGGPEGLSMKQIHALYYRARALKIAAHRLGTLRLPVSLDHGDVSGSDCR